MSHLHRTDVQPSLASGCLACVGRCGIQDLLHQTSCVDASHAGMQSKLKCSKLKCSISGIEGREGIIEHRTDG